MTLLQSVDAEKNIPMEEERFSKVEDERVSMRYNFRKVCIDSSPNEVQMKHIPLEICKSNVHGITETP